MDWDSNYPVRYVEALQGNGNPVNSYTYNDETSGRGLETPVNNINRVRFYYTVPTIPPTTTDYAISLEKTVNKTKASPGDEVTYTFKITNTGKGELTGIMLRDDLLNTNEGNVIKDYTSLAAEASITHVQKYTVPKNYSKNELVNKATVEAYGGDIKVEHEADVTLTVAPKFAISLEKTVNQKTAATGDTVTYTFTVTNTGVEELKGVVLTDSLLGVGGLPWVKAVGKLDPGQSKTYNKDYEIPSRYSHDTLKNTAKVTGVGKYYEKVKLGWIWVDVPKYKEVSASDSVEITVTQKPAYDILFTKVASVTSAEPGDTIEYTFTVKNTGQKDLKDVTLKDPLFGDDWTYDFGNLNKDQEESLTTSYAIATDASGSLVNTATATGFGKAIPKSDLARVIQHIDDNVAGIPGWILDLLGLDKDEIVQKEASATVTILSKPPTLKETVKFFVLKSGSTRPTAEGSQEISLFTNQLGTLYITEPAITKTKGESLINEFALASDDDDVENDLIARSSQGAYDSLMATINAAALSAAGYGAELPAELNIDWYDFKWENDGWHVDGEIIVDEEPPTEPVEPELIDYTVNFVATPSGITLAAIVEGSTTQSSVTITLPVIPGYQLASTQPEYPIYGEAPQMRLQAIEEDSEMGIVGYQTSIADGILTILLSENDGEDITYFYFRDFEVWYTATTGDDDDTGGGDTGGGGGVGDDDDDITITDDPVPAGPINTPESSENADMLIEDEEIPAGALPQTGGTSALLLYGLGTMLASGGLVLRRRENKEK